MADKIQIETLEIDLKDSRILEAVFTMCYPQAHSFASGLLRNDAVGADIVQEAFLYMWQNANYFPNILSFKCYLYSCVKCKCLNYLRDHRVECQMKSLEDVYIDETRIEHLIIEQELRGRILEEINRLPEIKKDIMLLRLEGNSFDEISEILHLNINTVRAYKKQAYKELRVRLSDYGKYVNLFILLLIELLMLI